MDQHRWTVLEAQGTELRTWRESQGLTQAAASAMIGSTQSTWAAWECGRKGPDGYYAAQLEELTEGRIKAAAWAVPRKGTKAAAEVAPPPDSTTSVDGESPEAEDASLHARSA